MRTHQWTNDESLFSYYFDYNFHIFILHFKSPSYYRLSPKIIFFFSLFVKWNFPPWSRFSIISIEKFFRHLNFSGIYLNLLPLFYGPDFTHILKFISNEFCMLPNLMSMCPAYRTFLFLCSYRRYEYSSLDYDYKNI